MGEIKSAREIAMEKIEKLGEATDEELLKWKYVPEGGKLAARIRDNKLNFIVYFRSWDLWAGLPSNLAAIQLLKEYMSSEIGVDDGELIALSKGLHLYEYAWELARTTARME